MEGKICLALSAISGDRHVTNNGRVNIIDNGNEDNTRPRGTNEIMEKIPLAAIAAIGDRPVTKDCNFDNIDNVNKYNQIGDK